MSKNKNGDEIREALVRTIIRAGAEGTHLDSEDCEVLARTEPARLRMMR